jgi:hypothetical protein
LDSSRRRGEFNTHLQTPRRASEIFTFLRSAHERSPAGEHSRQITPENRGDSSDLGPSESSPLVPSVDGGCNRDQPRFDSRKLSTHAEALGTSLLVRHTSLADGIPSQPTLPKHSSKPLPMTPNSNTSTYPETRKRPALDDCSNTPMVDHFTALPSRRRRLNPVSRAGLHSTADSGESLKKSTYLTRGNSKRPRYTLIRANEENMPARQDQQHVAALPPHRTVVDQFLFKPPEFPSPASSSELSPVGRRIMMDVRLRKSAEMTPSRLKKHS